MLWENRVSRGTGLRARTDAEARSRPSSGERTATSLFWPSHIRLLPTSTGLAHVHALFPHSLPSRG